MKISLNWLKEYIDIREPKETVAEILTDLGLEVDGMEQIGGLKLDMKDIIVGYVVYTEKHPNADKLKVVQVDIDNKLAMIVCGAPNVEQGQKVIVALPGSTVLDKEGKPFTIKKGMIRGEESNGMICAEDELGIGSDHSGIIVLPKETPIGQPAIELFGKDQDTVIEIGLTPNRSDATCHTGVARDLSARLQVEKGYGKVVMPDVSAFKVDNHSLSLAVSVEDTEGAPRYTGVSIKGVTIGESPEWLKKRLGAIGVRSISNVVDITNFILHELGQPLHAFDWDEIKGGKIVVKTLPEGTPFMSLDGQERKLLDQDVMICDGEGKGMCIAGVFGGLSSGVKATTTNLFLEAAHFNSMRIRRTGTKHNLRTDAQRTFEKGSDPNITVYALKRAALLIKELAGGEIASEIVDIYPKPVEKPHVKVGFKRLDTLIGQRIPKARLRLILKALEMEVVSEDAKSITVAVPTNKADVLREVDVIEEVLRIHGFNNVPIPAKIHTTPGAGQTPDPNKVKNLIADYLAANGFNEMMAMSLSRSKYYEGTDNTTHALVNNTSNVDLDLMRPDMLMSALEAVAHNQNHRSNDLRMFEFGRVYHKKGRGTKDEGRGIRDDGDQYTESNRLSLTLTGSRNAESWLIKGDAPVDFYTLKAYVNNILSRLGLLGWQETVFSVQSPKSEVQSPEGEGGEVVMALWSSGMRYHRGAQIFVEFGKVSPKLRKRMDLKQDVWFADLHWDDILQAAKGSKVSFQELSRFPSMRRDLALILGKEVQFGEVRQIAQRVGKKLLKEINLFSVFEDEAKIGAGKKSYAVSFVFEDKEKTLQDGDVDKVMGELIKQYEGKLGASIRK